MSIEAIAIALHHADGLTSTERLVLIGVANHHSEGGCWPSTATLGKYAGVSERNVRKALKRLQEVGYLAVDVNGGPGVRADQRPNLYHFLLRCPVTCDGSTAHRNGGSESSPRTERGVGEGSNGGSEATERGVGGDLLTIKEPSVEPSSAATEEVSAKPETASQRVNRLSKVYYDIQPLSKWTAIQSVVKQAIKAGYTDEQIAEGLASVAGGDWSLTANTLRIAMGQVAKKPTGRAAQLLEAGWEPTGKGLYRKGEFIVDENGKGQN